MRLIGTINNKLVKLLLIFFIVSMTMVAGAQCAPVSTPDADYPVIISVTKDSATDTLIFADHFSSLQSGNWIELTGDGDDLHLPYITGTVNILNDAQTKANGAYLEIESYYSEKTYTYPISTYPQCFESDSITAKFWGSSTLAFEGGLQWRLISANQREVLIAYEDILRGDTSTIKSLFDESSASWVSSIVALDGDGDADITFTAPPPGSYMLALVSETASPYQLVLYDMINIEILDFEMSLNNPTSVTQNNIIDLDIELNSNPSTSTGFIYGAIMIHDSAYRLDVEASSTTIEDTYINVNDETILQGNGNIDSFDFNLLGITSLSNIDTSEITEKLRNMFDAGKISIGFSDKITSSSATISLSTSGLSTGTYWVLIGVWEDGDQRELLGLDVKQIQVNNPPLPPSGGDGGGGGVSLVLPSVDIVEALDDIDDVISLIESFSPHAVARLLDQVSTPRVADILEYMKTLEALDILREMSIEKAGAALLTMDFSASIKLMAMLGPSDYQLIEEMAKQDLDQTAVILEDTVKMLIMNVDVSERTLVLMQLTETLEAVSVPTLVDLFITISKLPETPATVAILFEAMSLDALVSIVESWIEVDELSLFTVIHSVQTTVINALYTTMNNFYRVRMYSLLTYATIQGLPEIGVFSFTSPVVVPDNPELGEDVTVSFSVMNVGEEADDYSASLIVNGETVQVYSNIIEPGAKVDYEYLITAVEEGMYVISFAGNEKNFNVIASTANLAPAELQIESIIITTIEVTKGDLIFIVAEVINRGGIAGSRSFDLMIENNYIESKSVLLSAGDSFILVFQKLIDYEPGTYTIQVGDVSESFTVLPKPTEWLSTVLILMLFLLVVVAIIFFSRRYIIGLKK
jgi:methanogen extracellular protein (TIGR04279 family)